MPEIFHTRAANVQEGGTHLFIAIPVGRPVEAPLLEFVWQLAHDLTARGIAADLYMIANHCHVDDCRNACVHAFLHGTKCTDFLFIDSDTIPSTDAVGEILSFDRDVIAGIYPYKQDEEAYPVRLLPGKTQPEPDGALEVDLVPTGFLRIRRHVLEKMAAASRTYFNKEVQKGHGEAPVALIFERDVDEHGVRWGGDYNFCRKWAELGGKVHIDPRLSFHHLGAKAYKGNVGRYLCHKSGIETPEFVEAFQMLRQGDPKPWHFGRMVADWGNPYSASHELLEALYWVAKEASGPILETGSGLSSLVMAAANPHQMVHALEHDLDWLKRTARAAEYLKVDNLTLHWAPLKSHAPNLIWYGITTELPEKFAVALCDGPQRRFGRAGFYRLMSDRIADAIVLADDANDRGELSLLEEWARGVGRAVHVMGSGDRKYAVSVPVERLAEAA